MKINFDNVGKWTLQNEQGWHAHAANIGLSKAPYIPRDSYWHAWREGWLARCGSFGFPNDEPERGPLAWLYEE